MRHVLTRADIEKAVQARRTANHESREAKRLRRQAELQLLDKLHAELAMSEWYPER
jgi:hypothetical protein